MARVGGEIDQRRSQGRSTNVIGQPVGLVEGPAGGSVGEAAGGVVLGADEGKGALRANDEILHACIGLGGTVTGEHGVGLDKAEKLALLFTDDDLAAMRALRRVFDPSGLMNPQKIFPSGHKPHTHTPGGGPKPVPAGMWI